MSDNKSPSFIVREWVKEDCDDVMNMIMELANYENLQNQVAITAETLHEEGFGANPFFKCLVVEDLLANGDASRNGRRPLIGYALYFYKFSTWEGKCIYLEDIYVPERLRGRGIGKALVKALAQVAEKNGYQRIDFSVLAWNKPCINFYEKLGAINLTEKEQWSFFRLQRPEIVKLANSN